MNLFPSINNTKLTKSKSDDQNHSIQFTPKLNPSNTPILNNINQSIQKSIKSLLSSPQPHPSLHRSLSYQPSLIHISSSILSHPPKLSAEALLQRALQLDFIARSSSPNSPSIHQHSLSNPPHIQTPLSTYPSLPLHPVLADLEAKSRFNVQTECAICQKKGINFPKCPKCQLEFCSRACRVSMGNGEQHKCT